MELKIEYVPIEDIRPYSNNAKTHPAEQIKQIKKSIEKFGFRDPVATWHGEIVEGHGRIIAASELGIDTIPVIRLDDLTDEQIARKYGKTFEVHGNPLVVKRVENVFSHCEHHLALMYNMTVTVAYLPVETGQNTYRVIGLSKIPRIVDMCAKRLQLQEKLAQDIADCIEIATGSGDVYVNIVADHACVSARGAKNEGATDVTMLKGAFIDNAKLRDEVERKVK